MKRIRCTILCLLFSSFILQAQNNQYQLQNFHPVSPSAFQFLKYIEMPVSEYTGTPNTSIPLYQTEVDGLNIPINLTYHAGGIRVNQEASWVGLGWDLNFGSVIQEINDEDDYRVGTIRKQPDYNSSPVPSFYGSKYIYGTPVSENPSWQNTVPVPTPAPVYSYNIYTAYWMPINGDQSDNFIPEKVVNDIWYDSEPDIFSANFFGHSIKFVRDPNTYNRFIV